MTLDRRRGAGPGVQGTPRLDDVRVEGPLNEEAHLAGRARLLQDLTGSLLEDPDELTADDLALLLRVGDAGESVHEAVGRVHDLELHPGDGDEIALDLFGLARPQQAVVDEDAGQLIADGALHERGGHRRVDPAGQAADHAGVAHLRAYPFDLLVDDAAGGPVGLDAGAAYEEVDEHLLPERRVPHLGVPLQAEQPAVAVLERRDWRAGRPGDHREPLRRGLDAVAVAHPRRLLRRLAVQQDRLLRAGVHRRAAILAQAGVGDLASECLRHRLEPVADAQHRDVGVEQPGIDLRRAVLVHRGGPAGEDHRRRTAPQKLLDRSVVADDLGVDVRLAHAAGDQLGVLRAVVDHEHRAVSVLREPLGRVVAGVGRARAGGPVGQHLVGGVAGAPGLRLGAPAGGNGEVGGVLAHPQSLVATLSRGSQRGPPAPRRPGPSEAVGADTGTAACAAIIGRTRAVTQRSATNDMNGTVPARTTSAIRSRGRRDRNHRSTATITYARYR